MIEFYYECTNAVNLPTGILMALVLLYWTMVIIGVLGMDSFDVDLGIDTDVGIDADLGVDADFGLDAHGTDLSPNVIMGGGSSTTGSEGIFRTLFEFFYLGEVPIVIIGTFFIFFLWMATFITNHYYNVDQSVGLMLLMSVPNVLGSLIVTRYSMIPFSVIFKKPGPENTTRDEMTGLTGIVTTSEVTHQFGQMEIKRSGQVEITLNIRTKPGTQLAKGDAAKIVSFNNSDGTFLVELTKWEKNLDE